jgi:hypothetical protein
MPATISPLPGFDWAKVKWGGPKDPRAEHCSYCGGKLDEDSVPLILWNEAGGCAEFCDRCMVTEWGFVIDEQARPRAAYRDDSYPERACDHCGKPYRGPAVYCSFDCAIADT